ncbi:MAG: HAMP domain-containing histidine kinase, partial [Variovorax sp.]
GTTTRLSLGWRDGRPRRNAVVTLRDGGRGIAAADLPLLFERYSRFAAGTGEADPPSGHGLGLWLVKPVLERHHGTIICESTPGVGTTFVITLPEAPPDSVADS